MRPHDVEQEEDGAGAGEEGPEGDALCLCLTVRDVTDGSTWLSEKYHFPAAGQTLGQLAPCASQSSSPLTLHLEHNTALCSRSGAIS